MADTTSKKLLGAALTTLLATADAAWWVKAPTKLISELAARFGNLPDNQKAALAQSSATEVGEALLQLNLATKHASAGVDRIEQQIQTLQDVVRQSNRQLARLIEGEPRYARQKQRSDESIMPNTLAPVSILPRHRFSSSDVASFVSNLKQFVLADQIPDSGGWPISQERIFEYVWNDPPTRIDSREGSIVGTYMAVRGLRTAGLEMNSYREPGRSAADYLLKRRMANGAFGRFAASRSGEQIIPSFRHTALACLALMSLDGPPDDILDGVHHLEAIRVEDLKDDAAPSMAIAAALLAFECATTAAWGTHHLPSSEVQRLEHVHARKRNELLLALESEAKSPTAAYSPLWKPYGDNAKMIYDSSLNTIDLLTLLSEPPWDIIIDALAHITSGRVQGGLPYDPSLRTADVGISTYYAVLCHRQRVSAKLRQSPKGQILLEAADECLDFSLKKWEENIHVQRTYGDTVASGLLVKVGEDSARNEVAC